MWASLSPPSKTEKEWRIAKMLYWEYTRRKLYEYQTEIVYRTKVPNRLHTVKRFLNGEALLLVQKHIGENRRHTLTFSLMRADGEDVKPRFDKGGFIIKSGDRSRQMASSKTSMR